MLARYIPRVPLYMPFLFIFALAFGMSTYEGIQPVEYTSNGEAYVKAEPPAWYEPVQGDWKPGQPVPEYPDTPAEMPGE